MPVTISPYGFPLNLQPIKRNRIENNKYVISNANQTRNLLQNKKVQ